MSKSARGLGINVGDDVELSVYELTSGRLRQTAIIADADENGEQLLVELPAHDSADRGSPLKIGGRAAAIPFNSVNLNDRVDAWFAPIGALGVVNTVEPRTVYEAGRRTVATQITSSPINNAGVVHIAAASALRTKVLGVHVVCVANVPGGTIYFRDGAGATLFALDFFGPGVVGSRTINFGGSVLCQTSVNTALQAVWDNAAAATFHINTIYYQAP